MKITDENKLTHQFLIQYFTSTHAPSSPNPPKRGSSIGQWRPRLKCFSKERHFLFKTIRVRSLGKPWKITNLVFIFECNRTGQWFWHLKIINFNSIGT